MLTVNAVCLFNPSLYRFLFAKRQEYTCDTCTLAVSMSLRLTVTDMILIAKRYFFRELVYG